MYNISRMQSRIPYMSDIESLIAMTGSDIIPKLGSHNSLHLLRSNIMRNKTLIMGKHPNTENIDSESLGQRILELIKGVVDNRTNETENGTIPNNTIKDISNDSTTEQSS